MNAKDNLIRARTALVLDDPFFGSLVLRLTPVEKPGMGTMGVDGKSLYYDPKFVDSLDISELKGVCCHEVLHCATGHQFRRGDREHKKFNIAADYALNPLIISAGFKLPSTALLNDAYKDMCAEEIYNLLPEGNDGEGQGNDPGGCGEVMDGDGSQSEQAQKEQEWKIAVVQAAQSAKIQGKGDLPAGIARLVDEIVNPKADWKTILRRFVDNCNKNDYTWTRPNKRYLPQGIYLPSLKSESLKPIAVVMDTSGSCIDSLPQFSAELTAILREFNTTLNVIYCDAAIQHTQEFKSGETVILEANGGGGTDFRPAFEHIEEKKQELACCIFMTDGDGDFPDTAPAYPILWANVQKGKKYPFGEVVDIQ